MIISQKVNVNKKVGHLDKNSYNNNIDISYHINIYGGKIKHRHDYLIDPGSIPRSLAYSDNRHKELVSRSLN